VNELEARKIECPYCGEVIEVFLDCSVDQQNYIEDCQVCCRPIEFNVSVDMDGDAQVFVSHEND
jgi:transcription elongation factor Elf1